MKKVNDMRAKKILLAGILFTLAIIAVSALGLRSRSNTAQKQGIEQQFDFSIQDTTKVPEVITEQRSTQIEIVNGKKKIKETIIKMKGDSIIEKKVIEREENADGNLDIDPGNGLSGGFHFKQFGPDDPDSLSQFNNNFFDMDPFENDSIFPRLGYDFGPRQHFNFGFPGFDDNFIKKFNFDFYIPNTDMTQLKKRMDELYDHLLPDKDNHIEINPFKDQRLPNVPRYYRQEHKNKAKSMNEIITDHLLNDGFINDIDQKYKFELNEKYLKIDGKKQEKAIYDKYKKIIEDNTGLELEGEFNFNFSNKKKLDKKTTRI